MVLECDADVDVSNRRWVRNNDFALESKNGKLLIERVDPERDSGWYQCFLDSLGDDEAPYFSMILVHRRGEAWS